VQRHLDGLGLAVEQRDTRQDPGARETLRALNGHTQVPCLVIDGRPLLESADIIDWLDAHHAALSESLGSS
jgi:glutathione S-transferase